MPRPDLWEPGIEMLRFCIGGRELGSVKLNALELTTPFTRLSTNLEESAPSAETLPDGVDAFVIPAQPIEAELPRRLTFLPGLIRYVGPTTERYSINLRGTFAGYMKKFSAKSRYNLTRSVNKFSELSSGQPCFREFASVHQMAEFYRLADEITRHSWGAQLGRSSFADRLPIAELMSLAHKEIARGFVLFHGDRPIAYVFCRALGDHPLYQFVAYDLSYAKWSPGSVLLYLMLERLFAERRFQCLDLGEGTLRYKSFFATDSTRCVRVIYFRRSPRTVVLFSSHYGLCCTSVAAGKLLRTAGVKQKLKRLMMGKSRRPGQ
jgi:hypothetical protein